MRRRRRRGAGTSTHGFRVFRADVVFSMMTRETLPTVPRTLIYDRHIWDVLGETGVTASLIQDQVNRWEAMAMKQKEKEARGCRAALRRNWRCDAAGTQKSTAAKRCSRFFVALPRLGRHSAC